MISIAVLEQNFYPLLVLGEIVRCGDELPERTIHTTFLLPRHEGDGVPFVVSDDLIDDDFAALVLAAAGRERVQAIEKRVLGENTYGLSHILLVPPHYHGELAGRMDAEREACTLVVPIFEPEFSGEEDAEEFKTLRRLVPTLRWDRQVQPKIMLRFDNPATGSGTGDGSALVSYFALVAEIDNLADVADGFVEIVNFQGDVLEIVPAGGETYSLIRNRDDATAVLAEREEALEQVWAMLFGL